MNSKYKSVDLNVGSGSLRMEDCAAASGEKAYRALLFLRFSFECTIRRLTNWSGLDNMSHIFTESSC